MGFQKFYKMTITLQNKKCTKCGVTKPFDDFYRDRYQPNGLSYQCKTCAKENSSRYRRENPNCVAKSVTKWRKNNKEKEALTHAKWLKNNVARVIRANAIWYKKNRKLVIERIKIRRHRDVNTRLIGNIRHRLYSALKNNSKKSSSLVYLGCSIQEFRQHLESQFKEGMSWDNYGNKEGCWSIDHIQPCSSFDHSDEEQIKKCWHYSNMQPMWHVENLKKHMRRL
jgi:hypothetical protein